MVRLGQSVFKKMEKLLTKLGYLPSEPSALNEASLTPMERWHLRGVSDPSMLSPSPPSPASDRSATSSPSLQLAFPIENIRPQIHNRRLSWAQRLARVYDIDAERCSRCGGRLRPIGAVTESRDIHRHVDRPHFIRLSASMRA
ncbi:MAG: hypothetical protein IPK13_05265 [Deltaproteobacteria bacterium]|nr:hypothetical protein [Deltaproteobacteria bacterium]